MDYHHIEIISSMIETTLLLYIFVFMFIYTRRHIKIYNRHKVLRFTQGEVKERKKEISKIVDELDGLIDFKREKIPWRRNMDREKNIYRLFSIYNEFAVGINEGIYDEVYIKMVVGNDMIIYYKRYYKEIFYLINEFEQEIVFMPLELLLKKWTTN